MKLLGIKYLLVPFLYNTIKVFNLVFVVNDIKLFLYLSILIIMPSKKKDAVLPPPEEKPVVEQNKTFCDGDVFQKLITASPHDNNLKEAQILYNNAKFYYACGQSVGALVSYSCAAVLLNVIIHGNPPHEDIEDPVLKLMNCCLSAVKDLQGKVNVSSSSSKKDDDEDEKNWKQICVKYKPLMFKKGSSDCIFFDDVAGLAKEKKIMEYSLVYPLIYPNLYPKASRGILIYGPPGTGKTFLVKAAVNYLQVKDTSVGVLFFAPSPGDLKGKYVGETEKRIEEVFTCASRAACNYESECKKKYISIIFMDEMDAIGPNRDTDTTGLAVNSVNTLLQMMDGVKSFPNVAVVGATNYPWNLDAAILRRFDTQVLIDLPEENDIKQLLDTEINRMINLDSDKSDFNYCLSVEQKEKSGSIDKTAESVICRLECEQKAKQELKTLPPYNQLSIEYYNESKKGGLVAGIVNRLKQSNFSNSDVNRLLKSAATNAGELAVKANLFYSTSLVDDRTRDKYISCLTKFTDTGKAVSESIKLLDKFASGQDFSKEIYQVNKPKFSSITYNGETYYNIKCLLYKSNKIFLLDHPSINDIYIKYSPAAGANDAAKQTEYENNVIGKLKKEVDIVISFNYVFKQTNISSRKILLPISFNLINTTFKPLSNLFLSIKNVIAKVANDPAAANIIKQQYKNTFGLNDDDITSITDNKMFSNDLAPLVLTDAANKLTRSAKFNELSNNAILDSDVNFADFRTHNLDFFNFLVLRETLAGGGGGNIIDIYINDIPHEGLRLLGNLPQDQSLYEIREFVKTSDNTKINLLYKNGNYNIKVETFISFISYWGTYKSIVELNFPIYKNEEYISISEDLFNLMMKDVLENATMKYPSRMDFSSPENVYYDSLESKLIQLYIDDIFKFYNLANSLLSNETDAIRRQVDIDSCFKEYLVALVNPRPQNLADLITIILNRLYDNYKFVENQNYYCLGVEKYSQPPANAAPAFPNQQTGQPTGQPTRQPNNGLTDAENARYQFINDASKWDVVDIDEPGIFGTKKKKIRRYKDNPRIEIEDQFFNNFNTTGKKALIRLYEARAASVQGQHIPGGSSKTIKNRSSMHQKNKSVSLRKPNIIIPQKKSRSSKNKGSDQVNYNMHGGDDSQELTKFRAFCVNGFINTINENIVKKNIFIKTKFNFENITEQKRGGLFINLGYIGESIGWWVKNRFRTTKQTAQVQQAHEQKIIDSVKEKNLLFPLIFKNVEAYGFLTNAESADKTIDDDKIVAPPQIAWTNIGEQGFLRTGLIDLITLIKGTSTGGGDNRLGAFENIIGPVFATILGYGFGSVVGAGAAAYGTIYLICNIRNVMYSNKTREEVVDSVLLNQILNTIMDIQYSETTSNFSSVSANEIFNDTLTSSIKSLSWEITKNVGAAPTYVKPTYTLSLVNVYTPSGNSRDLENIKNKLVNINIPMQSFYYALSVVKSTYDPETGKMLKLYYENKDKFLEEMKKKNK
jgi:SpoVK/Ycf46/Vps4 family AAA+-type ATPase